MRLSAAINASLHVNILPGQGDTKPQLTWLGLGVAMTTSHMSLQSGYSWLVVQMFTHLGCHGYNQHNV